MYNYNEQRPEVFKEENQAKFLEIRDRAIKLCESAGCVKMGKLLAAGDSWTSMAMVVRLVELGELREIPQSNVAGQDRIFVRIYKTA